ncbi:hypothetical protein GH714_033080 [Hevea brasiliensis]|uniref:Uncharacterized protein n=1 Tax=Hevea brasiliensis TaxID=3981 RepID=A0A6A6L4Y8_HEVBR|nr:hypothetical protein GH714_033080 [Hevea brasiliensis]
MEGLWSVFGEFELAHYGVSKEEMATSLCVGYGAALLVGTFLGMISDLIFEAWVVVENEKQGHGQDTLSDKFWLMTFFESASLIGSQVLANWLLGSNPETGMVSSYTAAIFLAMIAQLEHVFQLLLCIDQIRGELPRADGRAVYLGLIHPCLLGARMLGSTVFPWLLSGPSSLRTEDCLVYAFIVLGFTLSIVAYDYQEIAILVSLFCLFHAVVGLIIPSLARLRTMHVPNELRGGMISLSLAPANAAILFLLMQRGYYQKIENSTMMAFAALGLFLAAGCMHLLKQWGKQPYQNWHEL